MKAVSLWKRLFCMGVFLFTALSVQSQCNIIYVTPTAGVGGAGTKADPASLLTALNNLTSGTTIKMAIGTYVIDNPLQIAKSDFTIEGGFDPAASWRKTSQPGATTILRSALNPEGLLHNERLVAIYITVSSNFVFRDLTISTVNPVTPGTSTYGLYMSFASFYSFIRVQVLPGNAAAGQNGTAGATGASGANGANGTNGNIDNETMPGNGGNGGTGGGTGGGNSGPGGLDNAGTCCADGVNGAAGGNSVDLNTGGGGGGGASGGEGNHNGGVGGNGGGINGTAGQINGGIAGIWGNPGGAGGDGATGIAGNNGSWGGFGLPGNLLSPYYVTGSLAGQGGNGIGGTGGGGGGGGGGENCALCINGAGNGGGGGGGGGQGGLGGTGGRGGGGSFGVFLVSNGSNGVFSNCRVIAGTPGAGGIGAAGGTGGAGGIGGTGAILGVDEIGKGGNGGNGGTGGNGGNGGNSFPGVAYNLYIYSGNALYTSNINYNLTAQPEIFATEIMSTNESITFSTATSGSWDFGAGASPATGTGSSLTALYTSTGRKNIVYSGFTYTGFVNVSYTSAGTPTVSAGANNVCPATAVTLSVTAGSLNSATAWHWYTGSCGGTSAGTGTSITVSPAVTTTYYVRGEGPCVPAGNCTGITVTVREEEAGILGNGISIADGDMTPSTADHTDFGALITGANLVRTFTIQNSGTSSLSCSSISSSNPLFTVVSGAPTTVAAGGSITFTVTFAPVAAGIQNATVTVNNSDCNESVYDFAVTGTGIMTIYTFTGSGSWNLPANWDANGVPPDPLVSGAVVINGTGPVDLDIAQTINAGTLFTINAGKTFQITAPGTLTANGAVVNNGTLTNNGLFTNNTAYTNNGIYNGSGIFSGISFVNPAGGIVAPGNSTGCLSFNNGFTNAGTIQIELNGKTACTQFDSINVTGTTVLGGTLQVTAGGGYTPVVGDFMRVLKSNLITGTFTAVNIPAGWSENYNQPDPGYFSLSYQVILPVQLLSFTAVKQDAGILLNWKTTDAVKVVDFRIERSDDGINFTEMGRQNGIGGVGIISYSFMDITAPQNQASFYYRLKIMEANGTFSYSDKLNIRYGHTAVNGIADIYPNPVTDILKVTMGGSTAARIRLSVFDTEGRMLRSYLLTGGGTHAINMYDLGAGLYFIKTDTDQVFKIIKK